MVINSVCIGDDPNANFEKYVAGTLTSFSTKATSIRQSCFQGWACLTDNISMPNVTYIGRYAFQDCPNLCLTSLPSGVTKVDVSAFQGCPNLALTSLPSGMTQILGGSFYNCPKITLTELPSGVTFIGNYAFSGDSLLAITSLPSGVTELGNCAFQSCNGITSLDLSGLTGVPTISSNSFRYTTFPFLFRDQTQLDQFAAATNWSALTSRFQIKS